MPGRFHFCRGGGVGRVVAHGDMANEWAMCLKRSRSNLSIKLRKDTSCRMNVGNEPFFNDANINSNLGGKREIEFE